MPRIVFSVFLLALIPFLIVWNVTASAEDQPEYLHSGNRQRLTSSEAQSSACRIVNFHGQTPPRRATLSPFWALEQIGADLTTEYLKAFPKLSPTRTAVLDGHFTLSRINGLLAPELKGQFEVRVQSSSNPDHGTAVTNLINGTFEHAGSKVFLGAGSKAVLVSLDLVEGSEPPAEMVQRVLSTHPALINVSWNFVNETEAQGQAFRELGKHSIVIGASGNGHLSPGGFGPLTKANAIIVGSATPEGLVSGFSSPGAHILAPADWENLTRRESNALQSFGGTSGAAPLVTGALANAIAFLPSLTRDDALELLKETSLPIVASLPSGNPHGSGLLNAYKLSRVAQRLGTLKSEDRATTLKTKRLPSGQGLGDFTNEAQELLVGARSDVGATNCERKRRGLQDLRKAFLLTTYRGASEAEKQISEAARTLLIEVYSQAGLTTNADFYRNLDPEALLRFLKSNIQSTVSRQEKIVIPPPRAGPHRASPEEIEQNRLAENFLTYLRGLEGFGSSGFDEVSRLFDSFARRNDTLPPWYLSNVMHTFSAMGPRAIRAIAAAVPLSPGVTENLKRGGMADSLRQAFDNGDPDVRHAAVKIAVISSQEDVLRRAIIDVNRAVRGEALAYWETDPVFGPLTLVRALQANLSQEITRDIISSLRRALLRPDAHPEYLSTEYLQIIRQKEIDLGLLQESPLRDVYHRYGVIP